MKKVILIAGASSGFELLSANLLHKQGHKIYGRVGTQDGIKPILNY